MNIKSGLRVVRLSWASCDLHTQHQVLKLLAVCAYVTMNVSSFLHLDVLVLYKPILFSLYYIYTSLRYPTYIHGYIFSYV